MQRQKREGERRVEASEEAQESHGPSRGEQDEVISAEESAGQAGPWPRDTVCRVLALHYQLVESFGAKQRGGGDDASLALHGRPRELKSSAFSRAVAMERALCAGIR
ncbi:hypothetical protein NDU88_000982 [Pleurodeles waltl]|uniref:Uncharacterized protein n=1 Tax=Pleurodeles waltl TaxID=8319 RepID=A0AAV7KND1_PLEWA|nr:hypothetical protein NDU88_000982 [Pleurodeles waltl]